MGEVGERFERERMYLYLWIINVVVQHQLIKHCKATIFQ